MSQPVCPSLRTSLPELADNRGMDDASLSTSNGRHIEQAQNHPHAQM